MSKSSKTVVSCYSKFFIVDEQLCRVMQFGGGSLRNAASSALDQYRTLIGNRIRRIEWYYLRPNTGYGYRKCQKLLSEPVEFGPKYRVQRLVCHAISASAELL